MDSSLTLASGSRFKRRLLKRLGVEFDSVSAGIDEDAGDGERPRETAKRLASAKATAVGERRPDQFVLGADQTIALDGTQFRKPKSREAAVEQLRELSGRTHDLWCVAAVQSPGGEQCTACVHFEMEMRELSEPDIRAYVDEDEPLECAGSYKIEEGGIRLFHAMRGDDYTAVVGLPLTRVQTLLERVGYFERERQ